MIVPGFRIHRHFGYLQFLDQAAGLVNRDRERTVLKDAIEDTGRHVVHELERYLETLGTVATAVEVWATDDIEELAAAGGGLYRALAQLDEDEQYTLLYQWSITRSTDSAPSGLPH